MVPSSGSCCCTKEDDLYFLIISSASMRDYSWLLMILSDYLRDSLSIILYFINLNSNLGSNRRGFGVLGMSERPHTYQILGLIPRG